MPVSFLIPAALAALAAVAIPVLIHLRRRPRNRPVPFPSLMFLDRAPIKSAERRRIHNWWLLALRALAIALVVLAFSRPFLTGEAAVAATGSGPTEHVVLVDRSWSMEAPGRWDAARAAAADALRDPGPLDRFSLVLFDQGGDAPVRSAVEPAQVTRALDDMSPGAGGTRFGPGLKLAQTILEESELPAFRVVVISDFQRRGWSGDEGVRFPDGTRVEVVDVAGEAPANHAVAAVTVTRERVGERERITPAARLVRTGGSGPAALPVELAVDDRVVQTDTVELPASGATGVVFDPVTLADRHTRLEVRLPADELARDDAWRMVLSPGRATAVHLSSAPGEGTRGDLYLRRALEIGDEDPFRVTGRGSAPPDAGTLAGSQVVILNDVPFPGGAEGRRLAEWVRDGGGLIFVAGDRGRWPAEFADLFPGSLGGVLDRDEGRGERLASLAYDHPVFELFRDPRQGDFTSARFFRSRAFVETAEDSVQVLARFEDGSVALAERRTGKGRVLVWTSTLDAFWTDLALKPVYLPFVHRLVRHASGLTPAVESFTAGDVLNVADAGAMESAGLGEVAEALEAAESRVALTPSGSSLPLDAASAFLTLDQDGFYLIRPPGQDGVRPVAVAVNVDGGEAENEVFDPRELVASTGGGLAGPEGAPGVEGPGALELRRADQERRQSLWRYFLAGALVLLVLETVISNRLGVRARREGRHAQVA
jgi:hypothetical protein